MGIDRKTYKRWKKCLEDQRRGPLTEPSHKLTPEERAEILKVATSKEYMGLSPRQIVPKLADNGKYIASESSFYRVLKE